MSAYPLHLRARPDAPGRWLWLVKWLLLIPHYLVLIVLWVAFVAVTLIGYVVVLFTGRYPRGIFDFNVGVLRWTWRVGFYGYQVLGTDRYPPFTLAPVPDYPADLTVEYPERVPHWQPLLAWLFAIPHFLIIAAVSGGSYQVTRGNQVEYVGPPSLVGVAVLVAAVVLLFTGTYPRGLFDLLTGVARWFLRVVAYVALLSRRYPPFRLDQGGEEPPDLPTGPQSAALGMPVGTPAPPARPSSPAGTAGRVVALIVGVLLLVTSVGIGVGGGILLALNGSRDSDGYATSRTATIATTTAAVTTGDIDLQGNDQWRAAWGDIGKVRITVSGATATPLFVGVAPKADVDRWLAGTAHDELVRAWTYWGGPTYRRVGGVQAGVSAPTDQDFWTVRATGTGTVRLDWDPATANGRYAVVLANADGSTGVDSRARVGIRVPGLVPVGTVLLVLAVVFVLAALALIYLGASGLGRSHGGPPPPPPPPAGPSYPPGPGGDTAAWPSREPAHTSGGSPPG
jgi:hypothetical protein